MSNRKSPTMISPEHRSVRKHFDHAERRGRRASAGSLIVPPNEDRHELTTLGKTIRRLRRDRDLSQEAFAESCNLHRTYICDVERGARNVTVSTLLKIASALRITVSELTQNLENDASR
jgi:DNA-binding XRE family transcriptional regulator